MQQCIILPCPSVNMSSEVILENTLYLGKSWTADDVGLEKKATFFSRLGKGVSKKCRPTQLVRSVRLLFINVDNFEQPLRSILFIKLI